MNFKGISFVLVFSFILAACGGGSGTSSTNESVNATPTPEAGSTPTPEPTPSPTPEPAPTQTPEPTPTPTSTQEATAKIVFPWIQSKSVVSKVTVRGTAHDDDGIVSVTINGQLAQLSTPSFTKNKVSNLIDNKVSSLGNANQVIFNSVEEPKDIEWTAEIDLAPGNNTISVDVEDGTGTLVPEADSVAINYTYVPINFSLDTSMNRVVGRSSDLNTRTTLVGYDYVNLTQEIYSTSIDSGIASCFKGDTSEYLRLIYSAGHTLSLHSYNLQTNLDRQISTIVLTPASDGFDDAVFPGNLVCGRGIDSVYFLVNFSANGSLKKSTVLEFPLNSNPVTVLTETGTDASWLAREIALDNSVLISLSMLGGKLLTSIDITTGKRTNIATNVPASGLALASDLVNDIVYVTTIDGINAVNINTGAMHNISIVDPLNPFAFSQVRKTALDKANNRIIVSDSDLGALIAVDLNTGVRSDFLSRKVGTGSPIITPQQFALSPDGKKAYIGDDGGNATEKLIEIDLLTGNRKVVGNISQGINRRITGVTLDANNNKVYVSYRNTVIEVDLATQQTTTIASELVGSGVILQSISDILFDNQNNRLLLADAGLEAIIALDITSGARTILSQAGSRGTGDSFENINSITFGADNSTIFASNQLSENIMSIDAQSGDRAIIINQCTNSSGINVLGNSETLQQVLYRPNSDQLLIRGDKILNYDLGTNTCSVIQEFISPLGILDLRVTAENQILAATFGSFGQYDVDTNEYVIISK